MASQQQQFEALLNQLMSPDNNTRGQAERFYTQTKDAQPNEVTQALLQVGRTSAVPDLRAFAVLLLRKSLVAVDSRCLWLKINEPSQTLVKRELLTGLEREDNKKVLSALRDLTIDLASQIFDGTVPRIFLTYHRGT